jgi:hypothetical protein
MISFERDDTAITIHNYRNQILCYIFQNVKWTIQRLKRLLNARQIQESS